MKRIQFRKEDIKEYAKNKWAALKEYWKTRKERKEAWLEKKRNSAFARKMAPVYLWMNRFSIPLQFLWACFINLVIESISRHSFFPAWEYMVGSPWTFLFNSYMIFITFLLVYIVRRRVFLRIIISVFWLIIGCVNGYMLSVRVTPFNAQDLNMITDVTTMLDKYFTGFQGFMLVLGILAILVWLVYMWMRGGQYQGRMFRIPAIIVVVVAFATMGKMTDFAIDQRVVSNYFGNIAFAYQDYGLPYCFSASVFDTGIDEPSGYSEKKIQQVSKESNLERNESTRAEDKMPNIIVLQLESFFDTNEAEFFTTTQDPIPTFHKLQKEYSTGYFKVPSVGAGTANTEFEVLTGMSMRYFGPGEYPYKTKAKYEPLESAASAVKQFGYGAHALHNNGGNFYSRADVFNMMGFDSYTSEEFMNVLEFTEEGWATDAILTEHIFNALNSTEHQDFVFGISVEGHGSYDHKIENPLIQVEGIEDEETEIKWEYFVNHLYATDQFVTELISELEKRGEPTVLVLYGDHLPTMGLEASDLKSRYLFNTNYVIWDNIGLEKHDRNLPAYQLMAEVFNQVGIHSGTVFNYHQTRRQTKEYLADLEMLQYDMLYGQRYVYGGIENAPQVDGTFQMGIKDVAITGIEPLLDGRYTIYGENMTSRSYIFLNGTKKAKPIFINDTQIESKKLTLEEGDIIEICQVGSSSRVFRRSPEYVFRNGTLILKSEDPLSQPQVDETNVAPIETQ